MKAAFVGGGSLRLLPIFRAVFQKVPEAFRGGEIRLLDLKRERAEAVARMVMACPEYKNVECRITVTDDMEEAMSGIDIFYLTMGVRTQPTGTLAARLAQEYGCISTDQLSINGGFLAMKLGPLILDMARKLERLSPNALMLIFANPVAVYSNIVNLNTKVRALGICGGFSNHRWDLTRLCFGKNEYDLSWNVVAAGVNHLSFILRGSYKGEDLFGSLLPRCLTGSWKCMDCGKNILLEKVMKNLFRMYGKYGTLIFSTEIDGLAHVMRDDVLEFQKKGLEVPFDPEDSGRKWREKIRKDFDMFEKMSMAPEKVDWSLSGNSAEDGSLFTGIARLDISVPILRALAGTEKMRIVASRPNCSAIEGLPANAACEYTMDIFGKEITPVENQYVPSPFRGLVSSLSEYQTLLAEAIAKRDPQILAAAFDAYPVHRFRSERKDFLRKMFDLYPEIDPVMRKSVDMML